MQKNQDPRMFDGILPFLSDYYTPKKGEHFMEGVQRVLMTPSVGLLCPLLAMAGIENPKSSTRQLINTNVEAIKDEWKSVQEKGLVYASIHTALAVLGGIYNCAALPVTMVKDALGA